MKKIWFLTLLWVTLLAWTLAGCWNNENDWTWDFVIEDVSEETNAVLNYNDSIVDFASKCIEHQDIMESIYNTDDSSLDSVQTTIDNAISDCSTAKERVDALWDWEWDSSLKDWAINVIDKYIAYYSKFSEILSYADKVQLTEEENSKYENLLIEIENVSSELYEANDNLVSVQEKFAADHGYLLESDDVDMGIEAE